MKNLIKRKLVAAAFILIVLSNMAVFAEDDPGNPVVKSSVEPIVHVTMELE